VTWNARTSFNTSIYSIAFGNGVWVAGGGAFNVPFMRRSTDGGINWSTPTSNFTTTICSVAYGNGVWVAGGDVETLRTSTDTVTWNTQTSNFGSSVIQSVAYGSGVWVAGGQGGRLRTSGTETITLPNFNLLGNSVYGWMKI
jgi:hypothetical protein